MAVRFVIRSAGGQALEEELAYGFDQSRIVFGRGSSADVRIPHLTVSDVHATVTLESNGYAIVDHESTNGTRVNGVRLAPNRKKRLRDGDLIEVGVYELAFVESVALAEPTTMERTAELARRLFRKSNPGIRIAGPRLVVLTGLETGKSLSMPPPPSRALIGRDPSCQLVLSDPEVSGEHAEVVRDLDGVLIRNLDSKNGIQISGQLHAQKRLRDADELVLGSTRLLFEDPAQEPIERLDDEPDDELPIPPEPAPSAAPAKPAEPPRAAPTRAGGSRAPGLDADLLIYALAAIVIAISIAGLVALFGAD
jgi:pSer/pThr/pTyr-binding forkhead associated (FHA) protein